MQLPTSSSVTDVISFDAIPVEYVTDLSLPDVGDAWTDASDFVVDSAVVIGKHGGRLVGRTARVAWRKRSTVATVLILALAVVGLVTLLKRRDTDDETS
jgi:hypothetical protein